MLAAHGLVLADSLPSRKPNPSADHLGETARIPQTAHTTLNPLNPMLELFVSGTVTEAQFANRTLTVILETREPGRRRHCVACKVTGSLAEAARRRIQPGQVLLIRGRQGSEPNEIRADSLLHL